MRHVPGGTGERKIDRLKSSFERTDRRMKPHGNPAARSRSAAADRIHCFGCLPCGRATRQLVPNVAKRRRNASAKGTYRHTKDALHAATYRACLLKSRAQNSARAVRGRLRCVGSTHLGGGGGGGGTVASLARRLNGHLLLGRQDRYRCRPVSLGLRGRVGCPRAEAARQTPGHRGRGTRRAEAT